MADLYGTNESEEMSSFLHNLLHNSLTSPIPPPTNEKQKHSLSSPPPQSATPTTGLVSGLPIVFDSDSRFRAESSAGFNFSDPGRGFMADARDCARNTFSAVSAGDSHGITSMFKRKFPEESDFDEFGSDCKGSEASDNPMNPALPRSTKRSRAAEVHNLSEKRRRCRINEKMKALQKLIPNSNKTDKASMLDEVIEYLKQLQLQVQMLSMRNGLNLHPLCFPESLHPTLLPQPVISFDKGNEVLNSNRGQDTFSRNQEISMQAPFDLPSQCALSNQPNLLSPMTNINHSESPFRLEPSIQNHYGPFNHLTPSKELCREDRLSQLQLDASRTGKNSSSGVSS